jgi:hypothetical protein
VPAVSEVDAEATASRASGVWRALEGRVVVKTIVRAPKLVNFVVRD